MAMAQSVKILAAKPDRPEFESQDPPDRKRESIPTIVL